MNEAHSNKKEALYSVCILVILIVLMFGALFHLKNGKDEDQMIVNSRQIHSFIAKLVEISRNTLQQSALSFTTDQNSVQVTDKSIFPKSNISQTVTVDGNNMLQTNGSDCQDENLIKILCESPHVILFRVHDNGTLLYNDRYDHSIDVVRLLKYSSALKLALQRGIIFKENSNNFFLSSSFIQGRTYLVTAHLDSFLPLVTKCDLILDWDKISQEMKDALSRFFEKPSSCLLSHFMLRF